MNEKTMIGQEDEHFKQMIAEESICTAENIVYDKPSVLRLLNLQEKKELKSECSDRLHYSRSLMMN